MYALKVLSVALFLIWTSTLPAVELVPESTSPNGKCALGFERPQSVDADPPPLVWLVRLPSLEPVSSQLTPLDATIYRKRRMDGKTTLVSTDDMAEDRQMMFETLVSGAQARLQGRGTAASYHVYWTKDARQVTVCAGEHKFVHTSVYRLHGGRFVRHMDHIGFWPIPSGPHQ